MVYKGSTCLPEPQQSDNESAPNPHRVWGGGDWTKDAASSQCFSFHTGSIAPLLWKYEWTKKGNRKCCIQDYFNIIYMYALEI